MCVCVCIRGLLGYLIIVRVHTCVCACVYVSVYVHVHLYVRINLYVYAMHAWRAWQSVRDVPPVAPRENAQHPALGADDHFPAILRGDGDFSRENY